MRSAPEASTSPSRAPWASTWSSASVSASARSRARSSSTTPRGEPVRGVEPGADGRAADRQLAQPRQHVPAAARRRTRACVAHPPASWPSVIGTASMRCVRPALTTSAQSSARRRSARGEVLQRGDHVVGQGLGRGDVDRGREDVVAALRGVDVVVRVHRATRGAAWRGWRSPRWRSCSSWCPTRSGTRRRGTARRARPRRPRPRRRRRRRRGLRRSTPIRAFTRAAAALTRPSARICARSRPRPEIGKFSTARWVCARHNASAGTRTSPMVSCSMRKPSPVSVCMGRSLHTVCTASRGTAAPRQRRHARPVTYTACAVGPGSESRAELRRPGESGAGTSAASARRAPSTSDGGRAERGPRWTSSGSGWTSWRACWRRRSRSCPRSASRRR